MTTEVTAVIMKAIFIFSFVLFGLPGVSIQKFHRRRTVLLQHPLIPQQFLERAIHTGEKFSEQGISRKLCYYVLIGDVFEAVNQHISHEPEPAHFPASYAGSILRDLRVQTLAYNLEGRKVQIEVIECAKHDGKILYILNADDQNNFYTFEKIINSNDAPLIRRAMKNPTIYWNIYKVAMRVEQGVYLPTQRNYHVLLRHEYDFQSNYTAIDPMHWKNISNVIGYKRFELCSLLYPLVNPKSNTIYNDVNRLREEAGTYGQAYARLHIHSNDPFGRSGFLPVAVIGCYVNRELEIGAKPTFYVAPDHRVNGGAFLLKKSPIPHLNHLVVTMRLSDVLTLVDLV